MAPLPHPIPSPDWQSLKGTILDGGYELAEMLNADEAGARFRVRILGDYSLKAFANFYPRELDNGQQQAALWETLSQLRQPSLSSPLGAGAMVVTNIPVEYLVLPMPDEYLAGVLRERVLTEEEAREVLTSLANALGTLHSNGFVHGRVSPEEVVATGDCVQLSTAGVKRINQLSPLDTLPPKYLAPESVEQNVTSAADVWCLGATLFEALKGSPYTPGADLAVAGLPRPFAAIIESCVKPDPHARGTLDAITRVYNRHAEEKVKESAAVLPEPSVAAPEKGLAAAAAVGAGGTPRASSVVPAFEKGTEPHPVSSLYATPLPRPQTGREREAREDAPAGRRRRAIWPYAGAAAVIVVFILLFVRHHNQARPPAATAAATGTKSAWATRTLSPEANAARKPATPRSSAPVTAPVTGTGENGAVWRLVLYTYGSEAAAQKMAESINQKHPGLSAEVFSPKGSGPYLVVAGGRMTRDAAARLRQSVGHLGMPRDAYIQNYDH